MQSSFVYVYSVILVCTISSQARLLRVEKWRRLVVILSWSDRSKCRIAGFKIETNQQANVNISLYGFNLLVNDCSAMYWAASKVQGSQQWAKDLRKGWPRHLFNFKPVTIAYTMAILVAQVGLRRHSLSVRIYQRCLKASSDQVHSLGGRWLISLTFLFFLEFQMMYVQVIVGCCIFPLPSSPPLL